MPFKVLSAVCLNLDQSKILSSGNGLTRVCFFQDDMIDDVLSFVKIAEVLKERGAYKIYAMATHGILSSDAPRLIEDSYIDEVRPRSGS